MSTSQRHILLPILAASIAGLFPASGTLSADAGDQNDKDPVVRPTGLDHVHYQGDLDNGGQRDRHQFAPRSSVCRKRNPSQVKLIQAGFLMIATTHFRESGFTT